MGDSFSLNNRKDSRQSVSSDIVIGAEDICTPRVNLLALLRRPRELSNADVRCTNPELHAAELSRRIGYFDFAARAALTNVGDSHRHVLGQTLRRWNCEWYGYRGEQSKRR